MVSNQEGKRLRVLVIGGAGYLGSELVLQLAKNKKNLIQVVDTFTYGFPKEGPPKKNILSPVRASIDDALDIIRVLDRFKPEAVIHLAAFNSRPETFGNFRSCAKTNYLGTANVAHAILSMSVRPKKLIFASTLAAQDPQAHFGISKRAAEDLLLTTFGRFGELGVSVNILRFAEIYGWSSVYTSTCLVHWLIDNFLGNNNVMVYGPNHAIDCLHISDAIQACLLALDKETPTSVIDVGTGSGALIKDLVRQIKELTDYKGQLIFSDTLAVPIQTLVADTQPAKKLLGFVSQASLADELGKLIKKRGRVI